MGDIEAFSRQIIRAVGSQDSNSVADLSARHSLTAAAKGIQNAFAAPAYHPKRHS
jgi:hypothetical protein